MRNKAAAHSIETLTKWVGHFVGRGHVGVRVIGGLQNLRLLFALSLHHSTNDDSNKAHAGDCRTKYD
jgi:hypothetical protein